MFLLNISQTAGGQCGPRIRGDLAPRFCPTRRLNFLCHFRIYLHIIYIYVFALPFARPTPKLMYQSYFTTMKNRIQNVIKRFCFDRARGECVATLRGPPPEKYNVKGLHVSSYITVGRCDDPDVRLLLFHY